MNMGRTVSGGLRITAMPDVPESGVVAYARYMIASVRAWFDRKGAMKTLRLEINREVANLDTVFGLLGRAAREAKLDSRALADENQQIDLTEQRRSAAERALGELKAKLAEENSKFEAVEKDLSATLASCDQTVKKTAAELDRVEGERRALRERKMEVERQQRAYLKSAEDREAHAAKAATPDQKGALRKSAEDLRRDAKKLEPERSDLDKKLAASEQPAKEATARYEAARSDLENTRRALGDARAGHDHRLEELEDQKGHQTREAAQADAEIGRRMITLGTLLNLNRVEGEAYTALYERIDGLRASIAAREQDIELLKGEQDQYDKGALVRGGAVLGGAVVLLITLICLLIAVLRH
jgi:chromosome segregation ATPase